MFLLNTFKDYFLFQTDKVSTQNSMLLKYYKLFIGSKVSPFGTIQTKV